MKEYLTIFICCLLSSSVGGRLIQNDWAALQDGTTLRYFNPAKYFPGGSEDVIWSDMGEDIYCKVNDDLSVVLGFPAAFNSEHPFKVLTHGFSSKVTGSKTAFVNAWMQTNNMEANVILVNWPDLAFFGQADGWDNFFYDDAARNSIDVGEYLGHCLAAMAAQAGISAAGFHLVGHSLGAHVMGKAGRIFKEVNGEMVGRITGADPAGPRFVDGPIESAIPELNANRLNPESGSFVDVIHTDGSLTPAVVWVEPRAGDLHQMGHMDFYPNGGESQTGCGFGGPDALPGGICSHKRSLMYFLHSLWEPNLFPSKECVDVDSCNNYEVISDDVVAFMGQQSQSAYSGERKLFYLYIEDNHWDMYVHSNQ